MSIRKYHNHTLQTNPNLFKFPKETTQIENVVCCIIFMVLKGFIMHFRFWLKWRILSYADNFCKLDLDPKLFDNSMAFREELLKNKILKKKCSATCDFQQCGMCDQQSLRSACTYALHRLVWVYDCQNATWLEITCRLKSLKNRRKKNIQHCPACKECRRFLRQTMPFVWVSGQ